MTTSPRGPRSSLAQTPVFRLCFGNMATRGMTRAAIPFFGGGGGSLRPKFFRWVPCEMPMQCPRHPQQTLRVPNEETNQALRVRQSLGSGEFSMVEVTCWTGLCRFGCPIRYATHTIQTDDGCLVGYSFQCILCDSFSAEVDDVGRCMVCRLKPAFPKLTGWLTGLAENDAVSTPSKQRMLDGLLHGLLIGAPGLTCEDPR